MPELPEVEVTARLLDEALRGARVESVLTPGVNVLKTFDPPISSLEGQAVTGVTRTGKLLLVHFEGLVLVVHLMNAGRLQLFEKRASLKDRSSRVLIRLDGDRELRVREFGTRQAAWVKLYREGEEVHDDHIADLGPEAWPDPPALTGLEGSRPLHTVLRDQKVIAGIGRTWVDDILWAARLSPFKRSNDLTEDEAEALREAIRSQLDRAITHYAEHWKLPLPDKQAKVAVIHNHQGEPCPRCGTVLEAVYFEDYVMTYCPEDQTGGRVLKDRRLSRLLK